MNTTNKVLNLRSLDLSNHYQKNEAAGLQFRVALHGFEGRLAPAYLTGERPHDWRPELDGRTAEMKALVAAETALLKALSAYDEARLAAHRKAKEKKS